MLPVIIVIGCMEGIDVIKTQRFKARIKDAIRPLLDEDKRLIGGDGKVESGGLSVAVTPIPSSSPHERCYNVEVYDQDDRHPRHRLKYDAQADSLRYWRLRHEAGWAV